MSRFATVRSPGAEHRSGPSSRATGGLVGRAAYWLSSTARSDSDQLRGKLIQSVLDRKAPLVVGAAVMAATAITAYVMTGAWWPLAWLAADLILVCLRLAVIVQSERQPRRPRTDFVPAMLTLGLLWTSLFAAASFACMLSGETVLAVMAAVNTAGVVGGVSSRNAPTPRYAAIVILVCCVPFAVATFLAPYPGMHALAFIVPLWAIGMYVITLQNHTITVRMIRAERVTRKLAMTDALTGLHNRMFLDEELAGLCRKVDGGPETGFTVLCLDLDGFKAVNDRYGHRAGDILLKAVAGRIMNAIRLQDHACRNGGDEFTVLLPGIGRDEATFVARRIISSISRPFDIGHDDKAWIGVSIGSAFAPDDGTDPQALQAAADAALYAAKQAGKGVHREYQDEIPTSEDGDLRASA